ncbi:uncharacterized protein [Rutidosis leptorrhynchoides]|uniref:uncharacterized protein n=1 Tax=Rutidosis leptorrhynchoides TaxID=125765 RepID=UPI003A98FC78
MDLVLQRRVTRCVRPAQPRILWKNLNEVKAETFKASVLERVEAGVDTVTHGDTDQMWNSLAATIRDVAKEALGVAVGTSRGHKSFRESWWISDEVQTKVALKQLRFRELITCREGTRDDRTRAKERYREAKTEAKKAVARAKDKAYENLYKKLDSKEGANDIYRIAKARERRRRDIDNIKRISQDEVRSALRKMGRNKAVGLDQIPIEAWRCLGEDGVRWLTCLFNKTLRSYKMPTEWRLSEIIPIYKNKGDAQICEPIWFYAGALFDGGNSYYKKRYGKVYGKAKEPRDGLFKLRKGL